MFQPRGKEKKCVSAVKTGQRLTSPCIWRQLTSYLSQRQRYGLTFKNNYPYCSSLTYLFSWQLISLTWYSDSFEHSMIAQNHPTIYLWNTVQQQDSCIILKTMWALHTMKNCENWDWMKAEWRERNGRAVSEKVRVSGEKKSFLL